MISFKPNNCSVSYRPLNIKGRLLMSASVYVGFNLADGEPLNEQDLWIRLSPLLGASPLDEGFPKARGEFLVAGSCHTPGDRPLPRAEVIVQVGSAKKHLAVFGERIWRRGGFGMTKPLEFASMPLTWEHAFGHAQYAFNQLGRGLIPDNCPSDAIISLPNIEYFADLIVDSYDRPKPAAMLPIPPHWAQRVAKAGTYDQEWKKNRWPWFPEDIDWTFFNVAPEDQRLAGFLEGGEPIYIKGMHPEHQEIHSSVPRLRPRCFATVKKDVRTTADQDMFREVDLRADTLWLFPEIMAGVLVYHGTTQVLDEEFDDVRYFFAVLENPAEPPAPIEEYLDRQWVKAAEVSPNFFGKELTYRETQAVMKKLWLQKAMGRLEKNAGMALRQAPAMPFSEARTRGAASKTFDAMRRQSDKALRDLETMPPGEEIRRWRKRIISQRDKLHIKERRVAGQIDSALATQQASLLNMAERMPGNIAPGTLDEMIGALQKQKSVNPWHDRGFPIAAQCRERLELHDECTAALERMSFTLTITDITWFGYLAAPLRENPEDWGLPAGDAFVIPPGLVLPRFDGERLTRLAVLEGWKPELPPDESASLKLFAVPGSDMSPLLFDSPNAGAPVVIVPGELEAWIVDDALGGMCSVLALPHSLAGPDAGAVDTLCEKARRLIKEARALVVLLPKGPRPDASFTAPWLGLHPKPVFVRLPESRTVLRASSPMEIGLDRLVQAHLSPALLGVSEEELDGNGADVMLEADKAFKASMNKIALAQIDKTEANLAHMPPEANIRTHMEKARRKILFPEEFRDERESSNMKIQLRKQKNGLIQQRQSFLEKGLWSPKAEEGFLDAMRKMDDAALQMDAMRASMLEDAAAPTAGRKPREEEVPDAFTRETVLAFARNGISLEGQDLSGLDLSGLDLSGACLSFASINECNFSGADLSGAILAGVSAESVNFASATLSGANLQLCSLAKCNLAGAVLDGATLKQASFNKCNCNRASFQNAVLFMASLMDCESSEALFDDASFTLASLSGNARRASFQGSTHLQTGFVSMELDGANFARANAGSVRMFDCTGEGLIFYEADMEGAMMHQCIFPKADFRRAKMLRGAVNRTELRDADFTGSILAGSRLDKSELKKAQLYGVDAAECIFFKSDLEGADMRGGNFKAASFAGSRLVSCNMRLANCFGADFRRAVFGETLMEGAVLRNTLFEGREDLL